IRVLRQGGCSNIWWCGSDEGRSGTLCGTPLQECSFECYTRWQRGDTSRPHYENGRCQGAQL
ncbi:hypothetical protein FOZ63_003628, partial [Perkinsus olseni]